jgi:glycine/D-amino acid oxidase-like deaminating enzyme
MSSRDAAGRPTQPLWLAARRHSHLATTRAVPAHSDVLVIGAGIIGLSTAYWLARGGLSVSVVEARSVVGGGASGRNGGLALHGSSPLEDPSLLRSVLTSEGIDAEYETPGHVALASSDSMWVAFAEEAERRGDDPEGPRVVDRRACEELLGQRIVSTFVGCRWLRSGSLLHPGRLTEGVATSAIRHGAVVATGTRVLAVQRSRARDLVEVTTRDGSFMARSVVHATSAAGAALVPELRQVLTALRGQMLATDPIKPVFRTGVAVDRGAVFGRQTLSGAVVLGGYRGLDAANETGRRPVLNRRIQTALEKFLPAAFPGFPEFAVARRWSGIMDATDDGRPIVGPIPTRPNEWLVLAFGGHGFPPALGVGKAVAKGIAAGTVPTELDGYSPLRFRQFGPPSRSRSIRRGDASC